MPHLIIIDDDQPLAEWLRHNLEADGYQTDILSADAATSVDFTQHLPDLIMVGDAPWVDRVRAVTDVPLILLAPHATHTREIIRAFAKGADDCMSRSAGMSMISARIYAVLRRTQPRERSGPSWVRFGGIEVHPSGLLRGEHHTAHLTATESALLRALLRHRGRVVPRDELLRAVCQPESTVRTVDTHINSLRRKIELASSAADGAAIIFTVHGTGYGFTRHAIP